MRNTRPAKASTFMPLKLIKVYAKRLRLAAEDLRNNAPEVFNGDSHMKSPLAIDIYPSLLSLCTVKKQLEEMI